MKIKISALEGQLNIKIAEITSLEQKVYLTDTEGKDEFSYLRLQVAKKNEEVDLQQKLHQDINSQLEIKSKEVLSLYSRLNLMDGEYKTLNNGDKADKFLQEKNREITSERDEAVMKVTRLYVAKEALEAEVKRLTGGSAGAYRAPQTQH